MAYLNTAGEITDIRDPQHQVRHHTRLSDEEARAAVFARHDEFAQLMATCGVTEKPTVTANCGLDNHSYSGITTKCIEDSWGDPGYWTIQFTPMFDVTSWRDLVDFETREQCLARRSACNDVCNNGAVVGGAACVIVGSRMPIGGIACTGVALGLWGICLQNCSSITC